ncbi:BREX-1 system phosphatase PglZ type B [bacterium]|nr:BREX-1 system phosphatase PglZ type B [bacterium]
MTIPSVPSGQHATSRSTVELRVLDVTVDSLRAAAEFNAQVMVAPVAILWTDWDRHWEPLLPALMEALPEMLALGSYDPAGRTGPAIWLRCVVEGALPAVSMPQGHTPILYLPGVSRGDLRAIAECPKHLSPLAELQYRSAFWSHPNGRDWSLYGFLTHVEKGPGLDIPKSDDVQTAIRRALTMLARTPVSRLQGRRLEARDFDLLMTPDPVDDVLRWLGNHEREETGMLQAGRWDSFRALCAKEYAFDPKKDGPLAAAEKLGRRQGPWGAVWNTYRKAARHYPHVAKQLEHAQPQELTLDPEPWPSINADAEASLRTALLKLQDADEVAARQTISVLEQEHGRRRGWVWCELGQAPLACALEHLADLARESGFNLGGDSLEMVATTYAESGWKADAAAMQALGCPGSQEDRRAVGVAVRAMYAPWLERHAEMFQALLCHAGSLPRSPNLRGAEGEAILFADGLRMDLARLLEIRLRRRGQDVTFTRRWSTIPSVTPTAKPAVSPVAEVLSSSSALNERFLPQLELTQQTLDTSAFRTALNGLGFQVLDTKETGKPAGHAWTEAGKIDSYGHDLGADMAQQIPGQLALLEERVLALLTAGWERVRIVTDHGWLLLPGGLPVEKLPKFLAETRWGRCAQLKETTKQHTSVMHPWSWNPVVEIVLASGIRNFFGGTDYNHGGATLQECVTPEMLIGSTGQATGKAAIKSIDWPRRGSMRATVVIQGVIEGMSVDLRKRQGDCESSVLLDKKPKAASLETGLVVEDDRFEGIKVFVVLLDPAGQVVSSKQTTIGGDE